MHSTFQVFIITIAIVFFFSFSSPTKGSIVLPEKKFFEENNISFTRLVVFVLDKLGNRQEDAKVTLYKNEKDYLDQKNSPFETIITDKKGRAVFKKVNPMVYFIHITKGDLNNNGNGVKTQSLDKNRVNKLSIIID